MSIKYMTAVDICMEKSSSSKNIYKETGHKTDLKKKS